MHLVDADVISEACKGVKANPGLQAFFESATRSHTPLYLSAVTIGDLCQGAEALRQRGDTPQSRQLEHWLNRLTRDYANVILAVDADATQVWGRLRVPNPETLSTNRSLPPH